MTNEANQQFLDFALLLAHAAELQIMPYYRDHLVSYKPDGTEVTEADRTAELKIRETIKQHFPEHAVLGEEFGPAPGSDERYCWIIDPLDGTASFTAHVPIFGSLIALLRHNDPIVGVIHMPAIHETVYAAQGLGCWFQVGEQRAVRIRVAPPAPLERALISASGVHSSDIQAKNGETPYGLGNVIRRCGKFKFFGDCLQHALVCRGKIHAAIDTIMQPWDIAALIPCVEEAGGVATTLSGDRQNVVFGGSLLTSCDPVLHEQLVELLRR